MPVSLKKIDLGVLSYPKVSAKAFIDYYLESYKGYSPDETREIIISLSKELDAFVGLSSEEQMKYDLNKIDTIIRSKLCHQNNYVGEDEGHSIQHDISLKYNLAKCIQEARIRECQGTQEYIEPKTEWAMLRFGSLVLTQKCPSVKVPKPRNRKTDGDNAK